jgi:TRAP-type mannitol/chloroaromatic compound transport system permease small subunit
MVVLMVPLILRLIVVSLACIDNGLVLFETSKSRGVWIIYTTYAILMIGSCDVIDVVIFILSVRFLWFQN